MSKLAESIVDYCNDNKLPCSLINQSQGDDLIKAVGVKNSFDLSRKYQWEFVNVKKEYSYLDTADWETVFQIWLADFDDVIFLVVTDDEFYPWPVLEVQKRDILNILKSQSMFEFFIFDDSMKKIMFDTHDSSLILIVDDAIRLHSQDK